MFFYCFIIICSCDCLFSFSIICFKENLNVVAFLDCQCELQEQIQFIETFTKTLDDTDRFYDEHDEYTVDVEFFMMTETNCSNIIDKNVTKELYYNETQPMSLVYKEIYDRPTSQYTNIYIIFLYNIKDDIVHLLKEQRPYNIFYIIQSDTTYRLDISIEFTYLTTSFHYISLSSILDKICFDIIWLFPKKINTYVKLSNEMEIAYENKKNGYYCELQGMNFISFETYEKTVTFMLYFIEIAFNRSEYKYFVNQDNLYLYVSIYLDSNKVYRWSNGNPFLYPHPSRISDTDKPCFVLELKPIVILSFKRRKYNLDEYLIEKNCERFGDITILPICAGENVISKKYKEQLFSQRNNVRNKLALTLNYVGKHTRYMFNENSPDMLRFPFGSGVSHTDNNSSFTQNCCINVSFQLTDYIINSGNKLKCIIFLKKGPKSFYSVTKVNISKCKISKECKNIAHHEKFHKTNSSNFNITCVDERKEKMVNDTCLIPPLNLDFSLEYVQCKSNKSQYSLRCIKDYDNQCEDYSHLHNCKDFICPESFLKCSDSYCIFPEMFNNAERDCPYGEDESFTNSQQFLCFGDIIRILKDICFESNSFDIFRASIIANETRLIFNDEYYSCVFSGVKQSDSNRNKSNILVTEVKELIKLNKIFDVVIPSFTNIDISYLWDIVYFQGNKCSFSHFDFEFQYWKFDELISLDISYNEINHSNYFKSMMKFSKLSFLNLSHNENLIIDPLFSFPKSLKVIDLSYTKIETLGKSFFGDLRNLRHLNLSHTLITRFKDMGLPDYFTLDTLYIYDLQIQDIDINLFRGLTIKYELIASDYVICCPKILNDNISVYKCHAPIDIISSCNDLVDDTFKRIVIWIVGFLTIVGNGVVLVYRIGWNREIFKKAYGLFITGLAISDFLMGIYLMIIAGVDIYYKDVYILDEFNWRKSFLCNVCGFLSTFSSETSTFFICLITLDRFLSIAYPFREHRFSKTGKLLSFTLVWFIGFVLALIPIVLPDWDIYSSNGLCLALPLSPTQNNGWYFSFCIYVGLNFLLFLLIALGQVTIFVKIIKVKKSIPNIRRNIQRRSGDLSVAKKLAFVAFSDFCCWFPVGILGLFSLNGYIFNREVYAWIGVFVIPINSALNPIIYTIPAVYSKCTTISTQNSLTLQRKL